MSFMILYEKFDLPVIWCTFELCILLHFSWYLPFIHPYIYFIGYIWQRKESKESLFIMKFPVLLLCHLTWTITYIFIFYVVFILVPVSVNSKNINTSLHILLTTQLYFKFHYVITEISLWLYNSYVIILGMSVTPLFSPSTFFLLNGKYVFLNKLSHLF